MATMDLAKADHNHNDKYYTKAEIDSLLKSKQGSMLRELDGVNIDTTRGTWMVPMTEFNNTTNKGTFPTKSWYMVIQFDTNHFVTQLAVSNNSYGQVYIRYKYDTGSFSKWMKMYNDGNKPTPAEIGAATENHTHAS